jgi:hypothetical protein
MGPGYWFDYDDRYVPAAIWAAVIVMFGVFAFLFATSIHIEKWCWGPGFF